MTIEEVKTLFEQPNVRLTDLQEGHGYLMIVPVGTWTLGMMERAKRDVLDTCHVGLVIIESSAPVRLFEVRS